MPGEGQPPFGWRRYRARVTGNDHVVRHPVEWPVLVDLVKLMEDGWGPTRTARLLNASGLRNRWGRPWTRHSVWRVHRDARVG